MSPAFQGAGRPNVAEAPEAGREWDQVKDDGASLQAGGSIKGDRLSYPECILKNFADRQRIKDQVKILGPSNWTAGVAISWWIKFGEEGKSAGDTLGGGGEREAEESVEVQKRSRLQGTLGVFIADEEAAWIREQGEQRRCLPLPREKAESTEHTGTERG